MDCSMTVDVPGSSTSSLFPNASIILEVIWPPEMAPVTPLPTFTPFKPVVFAPHPIRYTPLMLKFDPPLMGTPEIVINDFPLKVAPIAEFPRQVISKFCATRLLRVRKHPTPPALGPLQPVPPVFELAVNFGVIKNTVAVGPCPTKEKPLRVFTAEF